MKKTKKRHDRESEVKTPTEIQAERIINQLIEEEPRLRAAREAFRRSGGSTDNGSIVRTTLHAFRQRVKK